MCGGYWLGSFPWRVASVRLGGHRLGGWKEQGATGGGSVDVIPSVHSLTGSLGVDVVASCGLGGHRLGGMERAWRDWWPLLMVASVASVGLGVIPSVHSLTGYLGVNVGQLWPWLLVR